MKEAFDSLLSLTKDGMSYYSFLGSGPDRGRSPVEWGEIPFVRPFVRPPRGLSQAQGGSSQVLGGPRQALEGQIQVLGGPSQGLGGQGQALEGLSQAWVWPP